MPTFARFFSDRRVAADGRRTSHAFLCAAQVEKIFLSSQKRLDHTKITQGQQDETGDRTEN